jgi:hypothetical protein
MSCYPSDVANAEVQDAIYPKPRFGQKAASKPAFWAVDGPRELSENAALKLRRKMGQVEIFNPFFKFASPRKRVPT